MPLIAPGDLDRVGLAADDVVGVTNPLRVEESILRPALRPGLLAAAAGNAARGERAVALFEIGTIFLVPAAGALLPDERVHVGAVLSGASATVGDAVDLVRSLESALRLEPLALDAAALAGLHPGRGARVVAGDRTVGVVGQVAAGIVETHGLDGAHYLELDVSALIDAPRRAEQYRPISPFPPVNIDLAFVTSDDTPAAAIATTIRDAGGDLLESCALFDEFRSDAFGVDARSLAFALRFRALDRTLTDDEVAPLRRAAIDAVVATHGATLRG